MIVDSEKYCFINGLKRRHANLIFVYNGNLYDKQLLGFITAEAAALSPDSISVKNYPIFGMLYQNMIG